MKRILFVLKRKLILILSFPLVLIVFPTATSALTMDLNVAFSNWVPGDPEYSADYGTVTLTEGDFNDDLVQDVQFTVDLRPSAGGAGGQNADLQYFYFNVNPNFTTLNIFDVSSSDLFAGFNLDLTGTDTTNKPDGDGFFDVRVSYGNGGSVLQTATFYVSTNVDLSIENFADGTAATQSVNNSPDPNKEGPFTVAVHLQSTSTPEESEFVAGNPPPSVPDASVAFLLGSAFLLGFAVSRRKSKE